MALTRLALPILRRPLIARYGTSKLGQIRVTAVRSAPSASSTTAIRSFNSTARRDRVTLFYPSHLKSEFSSDGSWWSIRCRWGRSAEQHGDLLDDVNDILTRYKLKLKQFDWQRNTNSTRSKKHRVDATTETATIEILRDDKDLDIEAPSHLVRFKDMIPAYPMEFVEYLPKSDCRWGSSFAFINVKGLPLYDDDDELRRLFWRLNNVRYAGPAEWFPYRNTESKETSSGPVC